MFSASLQTSGGNRSAHTRKAFDPALCELVYVLTDHGARYLVPAAVIRSTRSINLGQRWVDFRVPEPSGPSLPL